MIKPKPKVFIIGASGFLGSHLTLALRKKFTVVGCYFSNPLYVPDTQLYPTTLKNTEMLESLIRIQEPDFVINATGLTDRDQVAKQQKLAENLNGVLPVSFAIIAAKVKARFLQLSCAEVYDGLKGNYDETETSFSIVHEFGKQKISAETFVRAQTLESTILRIGKVVGLGLPHRPGYFDKIRSKLASGEDCAAAKNKTYSYLSTSSFTKAVELILTGEIPSRHRLFNLGGVALTEHEFVQAFAQFAGYSENKVKPQDQGDTRNLSLNSSAMEKAYPAWKAETRKTLFADLLREMTPAIGIKKWQKILQTP